MICFLGVFNDERISIYPIWLQENAFGSLFVMQTLAFLCKFRYYLLGPIKILHTIHPIHSDFSYSALEMSDIHHYNMNRSLS